MYRERKENGRRVAPIQDVLKVGFQKISGAGPKGPFY
jgi:hypothetical protein